MEMNYTANELAELQNELHVELLPGTEIMIDVGSHHFVKSETGGGHHGNRVLVPQPSHDPHDPLNWSWFWKTSAITATSWISFTQNFAPLSLAAFFPYLMQDFNRSLEDVIQFTSVSILVLGFSNFIWIPIMGTFGRRPVLLFSQVICLASHIWRAKATSYDSFMGAAVLNGIGAGPAETIQPAIIADIYFLHDRGKWNTFYFVVFISTLALSPMIAGIMADHVGWQSFFWLNAGITALSLLMTLFGFPETKWHRVHPDEMLQGQRANNARQEAVGGGGVGVKEGVEQIETSQERKDGSEQSTEPRDHDQYLGKGGPCKQQWYLFQTANFSFKRLLLDFWTPWHMLSFPIVIWASFIVSWGASNMLMLNLTQSQVFGAPPYNWSSQSVGFTNFAIIGGNLVGLATAGPLSDWVSARATARNGGIREPEMRLPTMIPYTLVVILGNVIVAMGYSRQWTWQPIVVIGYACAGLQLAALPAVASTYAVDSYKPVAGAVFVSITVNKNLWGYGVGKFVTRWSQESGFVPLFMTNMALTVLWCLFGILFYYYGKTFRRWTKNSWVHKMD